MLDAAENTSLLRRLAGPSTGKAGLAKDQTEINRIIAEASKGSPFYENERKKDEQVTRRIEVLLKKREELAKAADIAKLEANAERLIAELEATRDLSQIICHVDMDAFYSSVEVLDNPELADKAFAVTGGGVLSTASYEARKWGVRSGMATFIAKKLCPDLICVAHHFPRYIEMSKAVMSVMRKYDSNMASWGLDEAYLNLTQYCAAHNLTAEACVAQMREEVHRETKLTCSAGIAPNKMLAKICSDRNKPNGQYYLAPDRDSVMTFTHDLSIRKIPGIGRVTERVIESVGIKTCGDIYTHRAAISMLDKELGLKSLLRAYLGIASNVVEPWARESTKSVGSERTFKTISDTGRLLEKLDEIAETLESDLEHGGWCGRTITLRYKLDTFQSFTRAKTMDRYVKSKQDLFAVGKELMMKEVPLKLRLIGLRVLNLKDLRQSDDRGILKFFEKGKSSKQRDPNIDEGDDELGEFLHEDDDGDRHRHSDEFGHDEHENAEPIASTSRRPLSMGAKPLSVPPKPISSSKPKSKMETPTQTCPICARPFDLDNAGFNQHIDFCLSKGAILEAAAANPAAAENGGKAGGDQETKGSSRFGGTGKKRANPFFLPGSSSNKKKS